MPPLFSCAFWRPPLSMQAIFTSVFSELMTRSTSLGTHGSTVSRGNTFGRSCLIRTTSTIRPYIFCRTCSTTRSGDQTLPCFIYRKIFGRKLFPFFFPSHHCPPPNTPPPPLLLHFCSLFILRTWKPWLGFRAAKI